MEIRVRDNKLRAALTDEATCKRRFGADMTKKLMLRMATLAAAESLADLWPPMSGPERCHELKGDLAGTFSIDLKQPYRLLFTPLLPETTEPFSDEQQRWKSIKTIEIQGVEDTHG
jgi:plasmid maintenance system killer protein